MNIRVFDRGTGIARYLIHVVDKNIGFETNGRPKESWNKTKKFNLEGKETPVLDLPLEAREKLWEELQVA